MRDVPTQYRGKFTYIAIKVVILNDIFRATNELFQVNNVKSRHEVENPGKTIAMHYNANYDT